MLHVHLISQTNGLQYNNFSAYLLVNYYLRDIQTSFRMAIIDVWKKAYGCEGEVKLRNWNLILSGHSKNV